MGAFQPGLGSMRMFCLLEIVLSEVTVRQTHDVLQPVLRRQLQADAIASCEL